MSRRQESAKYGHLKPGDKVLISIIATVEEVDHYSYYDNPNPTHDFTSIVYSHPVKPAAAGDRDSIPLTVELPETPTDGNGVSIAVLND